MFLNPNIFFNFNYNFSNLVGMRNLQEQVKKAFCYQKWFWPFTVWINCSSDLKFFENSSPSASNFKSFSWSLEQFFRTVSQNNFGNKIPTFKFTTSALQDLLSWLRGLLYIWSFNKGNDPPRYLEITRFWSFEINT